MPPVGEKGKPLEPPADETAIPDDVAAIGSPDEKKPETATAEVTPSEESPESVAEAEPTDPENPAPAEGDPLPEEAAPDAPMDDMSSGELIEGVMEVSDKPKTVEELIKDGGMYNFARHALNLAWPGPIPFVERTLAKPFREDQLLPEVKEIYSALEIGDLSEPFDTPLGFFIIYRVDPMHSEPTF